MKRIQTVSAALGFAALAAVTLSTAGARAQDFSQVEIKTHAVAEGVYMLEGAGGNIGVSVGDDGVFVVDDQFAPLTEKIRAAIKALSGKQVEFVINTHYHPDHTGGNENFGDAGALIIAHDNVRKRLAEGVNMALGDIPPAPAGALPVVTFSQAVTFHWNGDTIHVSHVPPAHTDGDALVYFEKADVLHAGDVYRSTSYPFIDTAAGGTFAGLIESYETMLEIAGPETRIIPGHGTLSSRADIEKKLQMLITVRDRIAQAKADGDSLDEVLAAKLTAEFDERWATERFGPDAMIRVIYNELP